MRTTIALWLAVLIPLTSCSLSGDRTKTAARQPTAQEGPHVVTVRVTGLPTTESAVRLGLFQHASHWLRQTSVFKARLLLTDQPEATVSFYGLPTGTYAIAAYIDSNDNARLDRWLGMIPREPVAFSQVAAFRLPPTFTESAFTVPAVDPVSVQFKE